MDDPGWGHAESGPLPGSDTVAFEPRARIPLSLHGRAWMFVVGAFVVGGAIGGLATYHVTSGGDQPSATPAQTTVTVIAPRTAKAPETNMRRGLCDFGRDVAPAPAPAAVRLADDPRIAPLPVTDGGVDLAGRGYVAYLVAHRSFDAGAPCPMTS